MPSDSRVAHVTLAFASATTPDLLRLVALPVFAWVAARDVKTRRVSSTVWIPLALLGAALLVWDGWVAWNAGASAWTYDFLVPATVGLGFMVPLAYCFWWFGGFGGADAKALFVLALLFPTVPRYAVESWTLPLTPPPLGSFSFTILTNAVLLGVVIPLALAVRNAATGRFAPVMFVGRPVSWEKTATTHGKLLSSPDGRVDGGLDLDALRMYLRWRGLSLTDVREHAPRVRDPATLPDEPNPPTDGAVTAKFRSDGGAVPGRSDRGERDRGGDEEYDDPWGAEAFLDDVEGTAYGTSPTELRDGLEALSSEDRIWVSPGLPFLVPVFLGLIVAVVYGDLLVATLL
jgi:archaeal preflagellin peptidase FlaK